VRHNGSCGGMNKAKKVVAVSTLKFTLLVAVLLAGFGSGAAPAEQTGPVSPDADLTARQVTEVLYKAPAGERPDFSNRDLTYLDLAGLDFKGATLVRTDLYGTDLTLSNLSGTDLTEARLDRAVLIRANLSGANLSGATIYRPTIYADLESSLADAPRFAGATMRGIRVQAELSGSDFRGADLTDADFHPLEDRPGEGTLATAYRNVLRSCDFSGARLPGADFRHAVLLFSRFTGADLRGAKFAHADLSRVDFSGADLTGADIAGADLDDTNFAGAKGLDMVTGWDSVVNGDRARK
jgi:uncharacterized protein YjbI with pentapeptide repeats